MTSAETFRLARMSPLIRTLTIVLLALPFAFTVAVWRGNDELAVPALLLVIMYAWVWLRFRPRDFVVHREGLEVIWPLKRRKISREDITDVRAIDRQALRKEIGWGVRVGAGGLWGGFGWLWTKRRGIVQMYVSRTDQFVWIELAGSRPWLITPEQPEEFVRALSSERLSKTD
jgi:hypothetical protein